MKIEKTNFGLRITIPEGKYNSEFSYNLRQLDALNKGLKWHPSIYDLMREEKAITRSIILRLFSMENFFKILGNHSEPWKMHDEWEKRNKIEFNAYFHDNIRDLIGEIDGIVCKYADNCLEGYPNHKYSCCI